MLALLAGCSAPEDPPIAVTPPEPAPEASVDELLRRVENVAPGAAQSQAQLNDTRERTQSGEAVNELRETTRSDPPIRDVAAPPEPVAARTVSRLIYQCTGEVTFAVRIVGDHLEAYPPGHSNGYVILERVPSDDGVHFAARGASFRAKDDLATLEVGRDRYVDCVSNPAAAVWQTPPRRDGR